jgi:hypothetical protein
MEWRAATRWLVNEEAGNSSGFDVVCPKFPVEDNMPILQRHA